MLSSTAYGRMIKCNIRTNLLENKTILYELSDQGHGPMAKFKLNDYVGTVSSAMGLVVMTIFYQDGTQANSIHGVVADGAPLGGSVINKDDWLEVQCNTDNH